MKKLLLLLLAAPIAAAQTPAEPVWTRFDKKQKDDCVYGYKDAAGRVRIPARFGNFTNARKFRHIMAVSESATAQQYYLVRNGRPVGRDSVYMFDYTFDCESEGKIRFQDRKQNRVGFFDSRGKVVVPAIYNYVSLFHNGLAVALAGARRTCWGESTADTLTCEHPLWKGGQEMWINDRNEVVVNDAALAQPTLLNWYSLEINAVAPDTAVTRTYRAVNGDRYTFVGYEKEFTQWFNYVFLPAVHTGVAANVAPLCYAELAVAGRPFRGWPHFERAAFVQQFYRPVLLPKLSGLRYGAKNVDIFSENLNTLIFTGQRFQSFLTDCNEHFQEKYPVFNVVVNQVDASGKSSSEHQEHFAFIRTTEGYRLFSVAL